MAHYAKIENDIVTKVIVAEQDFVNTLDGTWIQASYNTSKGIHALGNTPLRKNYPGIGYSYDSSRDAFISPKPYNSWTLNDSSCNWECPVPHPGGNEIWEWNDSDQSWDSA